MSPKSMSVGMSVRLFKILEKDTSVDTLRRATWNVSCILQSSGSVNVKLTGDGCATTRNGPNHSGLNLDPLFRKSSTAVDLCDRGSGGLVIRLLSCHYDACVCHSVECSYFLLHKRHRVLSCACWTSTLNERQLLVDICPPCL